MHITVWILGDQLLLNHPAIKEAEATTGRSNMTLLMIESRHQLQRIPYHAKKLVLLLSAMRHYARSLRRQGYTVDYRQEVDLISGISAHLNNDHPDIIFMMASSSFQGQQFQLGLSERTGVRTRIIPNTQFLIGQYSPFDSENESESIRQEHFYREMRQHFGLLLSKNGEPMGGKWNFDRQNRKKMPNDVDPLPPTIFLPDKLTQSVMHEVTGLKHRTGTLDGFCLAVTHEEAEKASDDFFQNRLAKFGMYEDAMKSGETILFHSKLSPYLNLGLLQPLDLVKKAEEKYLAGDAPINSVEGFIRQVVGWREFMFWQYRRLMPELLKVNYWQAQRQIPPFFWDGHTPMNCLHQVIKSLLKHGFTHHIERLMILSNFCLLTKMVPTQVLHWFECLFVDAYDWVMVPNIMGMGLYADGGVIASKPYIASSNYINKMSDYCRSCEYDRTRRVGKSACPFNFLNWHFLLENETVLRENYRMGRMLYHLKSMTIEEKTEIRKTARQFLIW